MIDFEWDSEKAKSNFRKHGVSVNEAKSVFFDEMATQFFDEEHSEAEDRFILLGMSPESRVLVVCHCERNAGSTVRIISARKATGPESRFYRGPLA